MKCTKRSSQPAANKTNTNSPNNTRTHTHTHSRRQTKREMNVKNAWGTYKEYTFKQRSHPAEVHSEERIHMNNVRKRRKSISVRKWAERSHNFTILFSLCFFLCESSIFSLLLVLIWFLCSLLRRCVSVIWFNGVWYEYSALNCASSPNQRLLTLAGKRINWMKLHENEFKAKEAVDRLRPAYWTVFRTVFGEFSWKCLNEKCFEMKITCFIVLNLCRRNHYKVFDVFMQFKENILQIDFIQ